jgi:hypothetical protein
MKGMFDFLEKAGLVRRDSPQADPLDVGAAAPAPAPVSEPVLITPGTDSNKVSTVTTTQSFSASPLNLDDIYAKAGIAPAQYPAERLLRLMEGLSAMDEPTRLMAIRAMDAADESWTMSDPLNDASAKVAALTIYSDNIRQQLQQRDLETQSLLNDVLARQEQVVGDIRRQISELEALVARELSRSAQETATLQAGLTAARNQTAEDLNNITQVSQRLQGLLLQLGTSNLPLPLQE